MVCINFAAFVLTQSLALANLGLLEADDAAPRKQLTSESLQILCALQSEPISLSAMNPASRDSGWTTVHLRPPIDILALDILLRLGRILYRD